MLHDGYLAYLSSVKGLTGVAFFILACSVFIFGIKLETTISKLIDEYGAMDFGKKELIEKARELSQLDYRIIFITVTLFFFFMARAIVDLLYYIGKTMSLELLYVQAFLIIMTEVVPAFFITVVIKRSHEKNQEKDDSFLLMHSYEKQECPTHFTPTSAPHHASNPANQIRIHR